jgi:hypothetical protein
MMLTRHAKTFMRLTATTRWPAKLGKVGDRSRILATDIKEVATGESLFERHKKTRAVARFAIRAAFHDQLAVGKRRGYKTA